jgi:hypothetical protein
VLHSAVCRKRSPKNIDRPRVKRAFHRIVEQTQAGQD